MGALLKAVPAWHPITIAAHWQGVGRAATPLAAVIWNGVPLAGAERSPRPTEESTPYRGVHALPRSPRPTTSHLHPDFSV